MNRSGLAALLLIAASNGAQGADVPGQHFSISPARLPRPYATSAVDNSSQTIARPAGVMPKAPDGFAVSIFASNVPHARWMAVAPNGDVFLAESDLGKIVVLRPSADGTHAARAATFAEAYTLPHGLAFANGALYVADVKSIWRLSYAGGQLKSTGRRRHIANTTPAAVWGISRAISYSTRRQSVPHHRQPQQCGRGPSALCERAEGKSRRFALDLRQWFAKSRRHRLLSGYGRSLCDGQRARRARHQSSARLSHPRQTGRFLWMALRVHGYTSRSRFREKTSRPGGEVEDTRRSLSAAFGASGAGVLRGGQFPSEYKGDAFVSLHGSWNAAEPTGYKVVRVRFPNGRPQNSYENFVTGFWDGKTSPARVWGRPVGLVVAKDGDLLIADDVGGVVWRVAYKGK